MASLDIILELGARILPDEEKSKLASLKNTWYTDYISRMKPDEILPGALEFISDLKKAGFRVALGSASKNTPMILARVGMSSAFDAVADGNIVSRAKPDPEVFLRAAEMLGTEAARCIVFEDAAAGVEAAGNAGMACVGIGKRDILSGAQMVINGLYEMSMDKIAIIEKQMGYE